MLDLAIKILEALANSPPLTMAFLVLLLGGMFFIWTGLNGQTRGNNPRDLSRTVIAGFFFMGLLFLSLAFLGIYIVAVRSDSTLVQGDLTPTPALMVVEITTTPLPTYTPFPPSSTQAFLPTSTSSPSPTSTSAPEPTQHVPPTITPAPTVPPKPIVTPESTEIPQNTGLPVGEWYTQGNISAAVLGMEPRTGGDSRYVGIEIWVKNVSGNTISFDYGSANLLLRDNLGNTYNSGAYSWNIRLESGQMERLQSGLCCLVFFPEVNHGNPALTELTFVVRSLSGIQQAEWVIPVHH